MHKLIIAIMGTDGAGKTTLLEAVLPELEKRLGGRVVVHHLKPDYLPPLGRFRGVKHEKGYVCTDPHGSRPSGLVGSLFRIFYLLLDYILGYWFKVRIVVYSKDVAAWVFDRYAYDILIDPRRFRIQLPRAIIRFFLWFVPQPDKLVCLGGNPAKIFARKPETSLAEVTRQTTELKLLCEGNARTIWIDTTRSLDDCVCECVEFILKPL